MTNDELCVYEIRNATRMETFVTVTGPVPDHDWPERLPSVYFPKWSAYDAIEARVIAGGLAWGRAELVLGELTRNRAAAGWTVVSSLPDAYRTAARTCA